MGKALSSVSMQSLMLVVANVANKFVVSRNLCYNGELWGLSRALS